MLARSRLEQERPYEQLDHRYLYEVRQPELIRQSAQAAAVGLGGVGGWLLAYPYVKSMSHLILHEYGHRWAWMLLQENADPEVHTIALENWEKAEIFKPRRISTVWSGFFSLEMRKVTVWRPALLPESRGGLMMSSNSRWPPEGKFTD